MIKEHLQTDSPTLNELMPGKAKEIAAELGLHPLTVRKILSGTEGYNEQTVLNVLEKALETLQQVIEEYEEEYKKWKEILQAA
jgi:predicted transcriptional regulator